MLNFSQRILPVHFDRITVLKFLSSPLLFVEMFVWQRGGRCAGPVGSWGAAVIKFGFYCQGLSQLAEWTTSRVSGQSRKPNQAVRDTDRGSNTIKDSNRAKRQTTENTERDKKGLLQQGEDNNDHQSDILSPIFHSHHVSLWFLTDCEPNGPIYNLPFSPMCQFYRLPFNHHSSSKWKSKRPCAYA